MLDRHQVTRGDHSVAILVRPQDRLVFAVSYYKDGKLKLVFRYVEYQLGLVPDTRLFLRPQGISFTEGRPKGGR